MIKKLVFTLFLIFIAQNITLATTTSQAISVPSAVPVQQVNPVEYESCMRNYQIPYKELFLRTLSAISACNYKIIEIQSKSSRVVFRAYNKEFWANVTKQHSGASTLRILPTDNNYIFKKDLIDKIFNEIDTYKVNKILQVTK